MLRHQLARPTKPPAPLLLATWQGSLRPSAFELGPNSTANRYLTYSYLMHGIRKYQGFLVDEPAF
jgi:hypothetical protein